ncbi:hypothetical protein LSH36_680g01005 [Paralvinella palmiformis]|uniref:Rho guanine nucleotide exchange factor 6/7 coiled-coil domain-containing protein n=1 Tax=Paralvinella palmiformis TaxID=53620 RepID=A0AAD9J4G9_9ANNE|nr:hypothetical protein LSH36_680g01005 [Paralvinella palmiformis]
MRMGSGMVVLIFNLPDFAWTQCLHAILESPQVLIVEEEKIIVEENKGGQVVVEEKSLVDTVYYLKDQVKDLKQDYVKLQKDLEEEKKARKRLENMLRKSLRSIVDTNYEDNKIVVHS